MHHCRLKEGQTGLCKTRKNENGKSVSINYGHVTSIALDPIEKKPLANFFPGSKILSIGSFGCNLDCPFCQNDSISSASINDIDTQYIKPDEFAALAERLKPRGNIGAAYTYNEPMIGYEYVRDCAVEIKKRNMVNAVITNGSVMPEILNEILPYIDAFNIDLKGFTKEFYESIGGDLNTVLDFIRIAQARSHVELTTLIIPGENDSEDEMKKLSAWIASVNKAIPLHITRFFPHKKMTGKKPTDISVMRKLASIASKNLDTVLLGNI